MGLDQFMSKLQPHMRELIRRRILPLESTFFETFQRYLQTGDSNAKVPVNWHRDDRFLLLLFDGASEIRTSLETLNDILRYISRFPYADRGIPNYRYLAYHYEAFLHETYLLSERVKKMCARLGRAYRRTPSGTCAANIAPDFLKHLRDLNARRGSHVHEKRHDHDTIGPLRVIEQVDCDHKIISPTVKRKLARACRSAVHEELKNHIQHVQEQVDKVFEQLMSLIFTIEGQGTNKGDIHIFVLIESQCRVGNAHRWGSKRGRFSFLSSKTKAIEKLIPWLYLKGISTNDMGDALHHLGFNGDGLSPASVVRMKEGALKER